jgi:GDP-mannose transporter
MKCQSNSASFSAVVVREITIADGQEHSTDSLTNNRLSQAGEEALSSTFDQMSSLLNGQACSRNPFPSDAVVADVIRPMSDGLEHLAAKSGEQLSSSSLQARMGPDLSKQHREIAPSSVHQPAQNIGAVVEIGTVLNSSIVMIGSACFFSVCSVGMLLVNKCAFMGSSFNSGIILGQNIGTCVLALSICCLTPSFRFSPSISKFVTWAPQVLLFVGTIVSSAGALAIVNVPTFSVFRNSSSLLVAVFEYCILGKTVSSHQLIFLVFVVVGTVIYGWGDLQFSARGYVFSALHVLIASMSAVAVKKLNVVFSSSLEMSFYNNVGSLPLLFIFAAYEYQASASQIVIQNAECAVASIPAAFLISFSALISQKILSATSWMALNNFNKIPVLVLSQFIFSDSYSMFQVFGLTTSVVASVGYSYSSLWTTSSAFSWFNFRALCSLLASIRETFFRRKSAPFYFVALLVFVIAVHQRAALPLLFVFSRNIGSNHIIHSKIVTELPLNLSSSSSNSSIHVIASKIAPELPMSHWSSSNNSSNQVISLEKTALLPIEGKYSEDKDPVVSVVTSSRNDNYGGNALDRLDYFLRSLDRFTIPIEIIIVEWNPIQDKPKISDIIARWDATLKFKHPIVVVEVSKANHDLFCSYYNQADTGFTYQEYPAKNVGFRHARGKYIIQTNPDNFYTQNTLGHIQKIVETDVMDIILGSPVRTDIEPISKFPSLIGINNEKTLNKELNDLDEKCGTLNDGHHTPYGDFMLFERGRVLKAKGFPEFPSGIHHFETPFVAGFMRANPGSQLKMLNGFTVYHFDHSRLGGGGLSNTSNILQLSAIKDGSLGCPNPPPINDENWGLGHLKLQKIVISNRHEVT